MNLDQKKYYYIGAIVACTINIYLRPDIYTPFIWALIFIVCETMNYLIYRIINKK